MPERTEYLSTPSYQKLGADDLSANPTRWLQALAAMPSGAAQGTGTAQVLAGQSRALLALQQAIQSRSSYSNAYMALPPGLVAEDVIRAVAKKQNWSVRHQYDWVYLANPADANAPICVWLPLGSAENALTGLWELLNTEPSERAPIIDQLNGLYPSTSFSRYLEAIQFKTFDDIPGSELANIIVSHKQGAEAWVYCDRVTRERLFGDIRIQSVEGTISSELHLIRPGDLLQANGGILVIDANELLLEPKLWRQLKHVLRRKRFDWAQPGEGQTAIFYAPEPVPLDIKVILTGDASLFSQLDELDSDFSNYFPFFADFSGIFQPNKDNFTDYLDFLTYVRDQVGHRPLNESGLTALLRYSSSLCEHQSELSLDAVRLMQLLEEAENLANEQKANFITAEHIHKVETQQRARASRIAEMSWQNIIEDQIKIDTSGNVVGQINGLTVVSVAGAEFGEPSRITASVHYGDGDIIDIERKAELSGNIHTKGVMILTAYLANLFAQKEPMPLSATLVFEQSYHEVDGDSASLAELCCLLSALGDVPIKQSLAVTGAIDQFGNVQAVGGINEKIEGYFQVCQHRGLNGEHGVVLPASNRMNLHLSQQVQDAVEQGKFHIYAVKHVTEAVYLLMNIACGTPLDPNEEHLFGRIQKRLREVQEIHDDEQRRGFFARLFDLR